MSQVVNKNLSDKLFDLAIQLDSQAQTQNNIPKEFESAQVLKEVPSLVPNGPKNNADVILEGGQAIPHDDSMVANAQKNQAKLEQADLAALFETLRSRTPSFKREFEQYSLTGL